MFKRLKRLRPDQMAWLHAKAALIVWSVLFLIFTPGKVESALGWLIAGLVSVAVLAGVVLSVCGLLVSLGTNIRCTLRGINIELAGLWIAIGGLGGYFVTQFFLAFQPEGDQRIALTAFAYALASMLLVRIVLVREHRKRVIA